MYKHRKNLKLTPCPYGVSCRHKGESSLESKCKYNHGYYDYYPGPWKFSEEMLNHLSPMVVSGFISRADGCAYRGCEHLRDTYSLSNLSIEELIRRVFSFESEDVTVPDDAKEAVTTLGKYIKSSPIILKELKDAIYHAKVDEIMVKHEVRRKTDDYIGSVYTSKGRIPCVFRRNGKTHCLMMDFPTDPLVYAGLKYYYPDTYITVPSHIHFHGN